MADMAEAVAVDLLDRLEDCGYVWRSGTRPQSPSPPCARCTPSPDAGKRRCITKAPVMHDSSGGTWSGVTALLTRPPGLEAG